MKPPVKQQSTTSVLGAQIRGMQVGPPSAAPAPSAATATATATAKKPAASATATYSDSDTDDEEEIDTRTDEQKQQDEIANAISTEIARVESLGYKFNEGTRWATVSAYLDAKELFEDEGLDITCCVVGEKKKFSLAHVNKKIAELRAVAAKEQQEQALVPLQNGE